MLDIEQITNEKDQSAQNSGEYMDMQNAAGSKTPQIPGLDLNKLHKKDNQKSIDFREEKAKNDDPYGANLAVKVQDAESNAS